jgi:hypothetical protein
MKYNYISKGRLFPERKCSLSASTDKSKFD